MTLSMIAFVAVLVAGTVLLARCLPGTAQPSGRRLARLTPEQVLAERFARGEIDQTEYAGRLTAPGKELRQ